MYETVTLTAGERSRMENEKQLYVLLKLINLTEKYYTYDKIESNVYKAEISKLIEKYNRFTQVIPNYKLEDFLGKYNISVDEVSWAKLVLERGMHSEVLFTICRKAKATKLSSSCRPQSSSFRFWIVST
jgi:hypothetical protein